MYLRVQFVMQETLIKKETKKDKNMATVKESGERRGEEKRGEARRMSGERKRWTGKAGREGKAGYYEFTYQMNKR